MPRNFPNQYNLPVCRRDSSSSSTGNNNQTQYYRKPQQQQQQRLQQPLQSFSNVIVTDLPPYMIAPGRKPIQIIKHNIIEIHNNNTTTNNNNNNDLFDCGNLQQI
jgi:hypothetical protein